MWTDGQCFLQQILSEAHHCIFYNNTNINTNTNTNTNTTTTNNNNKNKNNNSNNFRPPADFGWKCNANAGSREWFVNKNVSESAHKTRLVPGS